MSPFVYFPFAFVNLLNPFYAAITASLGRNIFWADGSYTNLFGKTKAGEPAEAPEAEHELAVKNLEARADRAEHRIETLKNIVEGKDKQITQLQADKKDLAKQIDEAYGDGILAARKGWLSVVKHFGLDKNKEFRDYVNDMAGENIIKNPDRYMGMDR